MYKNFIHTLDIGTSKIAIGIGAESDSGLDILGVACKDFDSNRAPFNGEHVTNFNLLQNTIKKLAINLQNETGYNEGAVVVSLSGCGLSSVKKHASIIIGDKVITKEDLLEVVNLAKDLNLPKEYMILDHVILEFEVDGKFVDYPLGMTGYEVKANVLLMVVRSNDYNNIQNVISLAGLSLGKAVPSSFLSAFAVTQKSERESGVCVIDIGAGSTDVVIYVRNLPRLVLSIPFGGMIITQDISQVLSLSSTIAESLKQDHASCRIQKNNHEMISFVNSNGKTQSISKAKLCAIVNSRIGELCEIINQKIVESQLSDKIHIGIILTGGVSQMDGLVDLVSEVIGKPACIASPKLVDGSYKNMLERAEYSTLVGGVSYLSLVMENQVLVIKEKNLFNDALKWLINLIKTK